MVTKIQKGHPEDTKRKRELRIKEALSFKSGTHEKPERTVVDVVNGYDVYFDKPGKEAKRVSSTNINDMAPDVGGLYTKYSFGDIWKDLLNLSVRLSEESYKKLGVLIYRAAYLLDCEEVSEGEVRFRPCKEILEDINEIQSELDKISCDFKLHEFLYFIDILAWNEDVKYNPECDFSNYKRGRINNVLSMVSIPLIFKDFIDEVILNKDNLQKLDYSLLIDAAQMFSRTRGIQPMSNVKLVNALSPFLEM